MVILIMNLSEIQLKDIISMKDGRKIGRIIDAEISSTGNIEYLIYMYKDDEKSLTEYTWDELESIDEVKEICAKVACITGEAHSDLDK